MTPTQKSLLSAAHGNVNGCLNILRRRATYGTKAKPTVAELNDILDRLTATSDCIEQAIGV